MAVSGTPARQPTNYTTQKTWERASIARRLVAWLIDMAIVLLVVLAIGAIFGLTRSRTTDLVLQDERCVDTPLDVLFHGVLRPEQQAAAEAMLRHEMGVLSATTAPSLRGGRWSLTAWRFIMARPRNS